MPKPRSRKWDMDSELGLPDIQSSGVGQEQPLPALPSPPLALGSSKPRCNTH